MKTCFVKYLIFICLCFLQCDLWQRISGPEEAAGVSVYTDKLHYSLSDTIKITLKNGSDQPVYLEGCNVFYMNTATDTGWVVSPMVVCVWEGFARKIAPGQRYTESYYAGLLQTGEHRFTVSVFRSCTDGKPISQAECQSSETLNSAVFTLSR